MKLYVEASEDIDINDAFTCSSIEFEYYDELENNTLIPPNQDCFLFVSLKNNIFNLSAEELKNWLDTFFKNNSFLIISQKIDILVELNRLVRKSLISVLNKYKKNILIYYIGTIEEKFFKNFLDLKLIKKQESEFISRVSYYNNQIESISRTNNYLLTTIIKEDRPHRALLVNELQKKDLIKHQIGKTHFGDIKNESDYEKFWVGNTNKLHSWLDGMISWDLYNQASFEIVPESYYKNATWLTEKTLKPIVARIPFLILSNADFYKDLKKIGFKTFDSLIDESFAYEPVIELRTQKLVTTVKSIIGQGGIDFYNAAQEICDYNFDHFLFLKSKDEYRAYVNLMNFKNYI
jgi:hypothetical protein